jgi:hypothetical protein
MDSYYPGRKNLPKRERPILHWCVPGTGSPQVSIAPPRTPRTGCGCDHRFGDVYNRAPVTENPEKRARWIEDIKRCPPCVEVYLASTTRPPPAWVVEALASAPPDFQDPAS